MRAGCRGGLATGHTSRTSALTSGVALTLALWSVLLSPALAQEPPTPADIEGPPSAVADLAHDVDQSTDALNTQLLVDGLIPTVVGGGYLGLSVAMMATSPSMWGVLGIFMGGSVLGPGLAVLYKRGEIAARHRTFKSMPERTPSEATAKEARGLENLEYNAGLARSFRLAEIGASAYVGLMVLNASISIATYERTPLTGWYVLGGSLTAFAIARLFLTTTPEKLWAQRREKRVSLAPFLVPAGGPSEGLIAGIQVRF